MAVALKSDGYGMLPYFGVSATLIQQAKAAGVTVEQPSPGSFHIKAAGKVFGSVTVKGQAITLAKNGTLGPASKESLKYQFEQGLKLALQAAPSTTFVDPMPKVDVSVPEVYKQAQTLYDSSDILSEIKTGPSLSEVKKQFGEHSAEVGMHLPPCSLLDAAKLYQPVHGTSSGSVYVVVALLEGLNLAARFMSGKLSLRAEGPALKGYIGALSDVGFSHKVKDHYASVHFDIQDDGLLLKTFGAVLGRLGFDKLTAQADLLKIKGMGK